MKDKLARTLFLLAKTRAVGKVVRICFAYYSFILPLKRIKETSKVLVFYHPKPTYANHILIVPKKDIPNLLALSQYPEYITAVFTAAQDIITELNWEHGTYTLRANGGPRQEVQQVHFHLSSEHSPIQTPSSEAHTRIVDQSTGVKIVQYFQSDGSIHLALIPQHEKPAQEVQASSSQHNQILKALLGVLPTLDNQFHLSRRGYTLIMDNLDPNDPSAFVWDIVARSSDQQAQQSIGAEEYQQPGVS
jgi:histidine triad (HIT) family protein